MSVTDRLDGLRRVFADDEVRALSRRYFVANGFDGTLTSIGVVVGAYLSGIGDGLTVIAIGLGAAVGLGTSGVWSVWEIERAETSRERNEIENSMLITLADTRLARDHRTEQAIHASAAAAGPVIGVVVVLSPFLLEGVIFTTFQALLAAIALGILLLAAVGAYMGSISKQRWYVAAIRMGLAGVVVAGISVLLPG